ncbi:helix-turn-helix domain-containing protein [Bradyrhizobium sp. LTSP885]|uniref:helix-turn-helix domain-containing protein n=1 Tax=Bradyrhizobium sp. LTSP885 TaxID=1619232 RepID=UPI0018CE0C28|nr:helix-turn-helix domain-containing protein [Bradyrhizobium sp. LTSP885]
MLSVSTFVDVALQSDSIEGWDLNYAQMEPGQFRGTLRALRLPGLQILLETNNLLLNEYGSAWPKCYVFGIPLSMAGEGSFNGMAWGSASAVVFRGDKEHDAVVPPMEMLVLAIDRELMQDYMWTVEHVSTRSWLDHGPLIVNDADATRRTGSQLLSVLRTCFDDASVALDPRSAITHQTLACLAPLVCANQPSPRQSLSSFGRSQVVKRAREYIIEHIDDPLQIIDVCRALKVSRRTLQYSFTDVLGVNPATYLRVLRLNGARRDLLSADYDRPMQIKEVVARWGFWHLSRFSAEYRQLFGELPSATLRSRPS